MVSSLKLVFGDDIRKVPFSSLTMDSLHQMIKSSFTELQHSSMNDLYLYYIDEDNDKIRVKFDLELEEALRQTKSERVLKIFVINIAAPTSTSATTNDAAILPFINLLASLSSAESLNLPPPLLSPALRSSDFTHINRSTCEFGVEASPKCTSVSTNTLIDAKDVGTETPSQSVTQTTQTCHSSPNNTHQTTQTQHNASCATQTAAKQQGAYGTSGTQTIQTHTTQSAQTTRNTQETQAMATQTAQTKQAMQAMATQTAQNTQATCTQTAQNSHSVQETQTMQNMQAMATQTARNVNAICTQTAQTTHAAQETQTMQPAQQSTQTNFFNSIGGTQFGDLLAKLQELGFTDREKCVQALAKYSGKLDEAIDELLLEGLLD